MEIFQCFGREAFRRKSSFWKILKAVDGYVDGLFCGTFMVVTDLFLRPFDSSSGSVHFSFEVFLLDIAEHFHAGMSGAHDVEGLAGFAIFVGWNVEVFQEYFPSIGKEKLDEFFVRHFGQGGVFHRHGLLPAG
ncbi:MAG: hypothetical protein UW87_C0019G0014 [Candidatus Moranbacteria bacterium GW2011_GWC2_45_10]|nr:MAG: hypothetical protein UW87_C0019G0014 [Candidatus Moranbacteria bacterium GW2011_GWC2_45_10]